MPWLILLGVILVSVAPADAEECAGGAQWSTVKGVVDFDDDPMAMHATGTPYFLSITKNLSPVPLHAIGAYFRDRGAGENPHPYDPAVVKVMEPLLGRRVEVTGCYDGSLFGYIDNVSNLVLVSPSQPEEAGSFTQSAAL